MPFDQQHEPSDEQFRLLVDGVTDYALFRLDTEGNVASWNPGAERLFGYSAGEILGQPGTRLFVEDEAASERQLSDFRWCQRQDGSRFWGEGSMTPVRGQDGQPRGFAQIVRDASEQQRGEAEFVDRTHLLALTAEVGSALATRKTIAEMLSGCAEALVTHLDAAFARIWTLNAAQDTLELQASAGLYTHLNGPHGRVPVGQFKIGLIAQERKPHLTNAVIGDPRVGDQEWAAREGMVAFAGYPLIVNERLVGVVAMFARRPLSDVTLAGIGSVANEIAVGIERKRAEEGLRLSEERYRAAFTHAAVGATLADLQGRFLSVNAAYCAITGYSEAELLAADFPSITHPDDRAENAVLMMRLQAGEIPSFVIQKRYVHKTGPVVWVQNSVALVRDSEGRPANTVALTEDITDRKKAEEEREWLLQQVKARADMEALLNRIGEAIRSTDDPDQVQAVAVRALGEALGADRAYFTVYDIPQDNARITEDYRRADLADLLSLAGAYRISDLQFDPLALYPDGQTLVLSDIRNGDLPEVLTATLNALRVRALVSIPLFDGEALVGTLAVAMADEPRAWMAEEIFLAESVAVQTRAAVDNARTQQREHRIAMELQDALQPRVPESVPGLRVASLTRPALEEANIGGDFFDVFALDKDLYALVVGDVSGKGLAAAAQIALVRNSLRTTLYLYRMPAEAVTNLNTILTTHDLLAGFVTAFVGIYDAASARITYASCGHEPGLVHRAATGRVESLETTGTPLGVAENTVYGEKSMTLSSGDTLFLYTDGLSEAGPNRREMLGTEGLIRLLTAVPAEEDVHAAAQRLVADAHAHANGIFRDDVCVLLVRRQ